MSLLNNSNEFLQSCIQNSIINLLLRVISVGGGVLLLGKLYVKYERKRKRRNYPKDTVILHQFPRGYRCPRYRKIFEICKTK